MISLAGFTNAPHRRLLISSLRNFGFESLSHKFVFNWPAPLWSDHDRCLLYLQLRLETNRQLAIGNSHRLSFQLNNQLTGRASPCAHHFAKPKPPNNLGVTRLAEPGETRQPSNSTKRLKIILHLHKLTLPFIIVATLLARMIRSSKLHKPAIHSPLSGVPNE